MADSKIDWTDKVWNPTTGCTMGCNYCYAEKMAHRLQLMGQEKYKLGFAPACHPAELEKPLRWKKPARIFVNSMGDLFDSAIPFGFVDQIMLVINRCPQHTFQILTKHPERMLEYFQELAAPGTDTKTSRRMLRNPNYISHGFHAMRLRYLQGDSLPNLWLGVTVTCQEDLHRWWDLWSTPATIRFISLEPLIGPICFDNGAGKFLDKLDWVIVGGMTGLEEDLIKYLLNKVDPNKGLTDPDEVPDVVTQITSNPGDLWQLGRHRLLCGDSTLQADVERLMDGKTATLAFTDPPYNVDYKGGTKDKLKIKNDNMTPEEFHEFLCKVFTNMKMACSPGASFYVCYSDAEAINFRSALMKTGWLVKQTIIWVKNQFVLGRQDFQGRHEPILYGWEASTSHKWYGGRNQSTVIEEMPGLEISRIDDEYFLNFTNGVMSVLLKMRDYDVVSISDDTVSSVWKIKKPLKNAEHPTIKPVAIPTRGINNSSRPGEIVVDLFLGSGTTMVSCEQTGRTCFGMELDPKYADVIVNRWQNFTGRDAILLGDGRTFNQIKGEVAA